MSATLSPSPAIRDFASAVRAALGDLPMDEIEELTDGLESDLMEQAQDAGPQDFALGDPTGYAEELRAAAGLPARGVRRPRVSGSLRSFRSGIRGWRMNAARSIRSTTLGSRGLDFAVALRPLWWVLRGWALFEIVVLMITRGYPQGYWPIGAAFLLSFVVISVQWGRGRWMPQAWLRACKVLVSVAAVLALPFLLSTVIPWVYSPTHASPEAAPEAPQGLLQDGNQISNIFAYDADGQPLEDVQLFDQHGNPLVTSYDVREPVMWVSDPDGTEAYLVPSSRAQGKAGWNVFPLYRADVRETGGQPDLAGTAPSTPPFAQIQPLARPNPSDSSGTPSPQPTPVPTPDVTPSPES